MGSTGTSYSPTTTDSNVPFLSITDPSLTSPIAFRHPLKTAPGAERQGTVEYRKRSEDMPRKPLTVGEWCVPFPGAKGNGVAVPAQPANNIAELRSGSIGSSIRGQCCVSFGQSSKRSKL